MADRIRVHIEGKEYAVVGGEFQEMLAAIKQVAGRRFVSDLKVWQLPGTAEEIQHQLAISGYELEGGKPIADTPPPTTGRPPAGPAPAAGGDRIRIEVEAYRLAVVGGPFREMLDVVKNLPGRRFNSNSKVWEIPGDIGVVKGLIEAAGFQLEGAEKIELGPVPEMEPLSLAGPPAPPPYETPDFDSPDDGPPPEIPDWWDDDSMPPPLMPDDEWPVPDFEPPDFAEPRPASQASPAGQTGPAPRSGGDRVRLRLGDTALVVSGGSFQEILTAIKSIPGRRFNGQEKIWEIPDDVSLDSIAQAMAAAGLRLSEA